MCSGTPVAIGFGYSADGCRNSHEQRTLLRVAGGGCFARSLGYTHSCRGSLKDPTSYYDNWN